MNRYLKLLRQMMAYEKGCPQRIQHFLKVTSFAEQIGCMENLDEITYQILQTAAIVHDIGIKPAIEKHGSDRGKYQELEGPPVAKAMLTELAYPQSIVDRVCYLVGHHHTYKDIDGIDYQILVEADFLVNMYENGMNAYAIKSALNKIFRTKTGKEYCQIMFNVD